MSKDEGSSKEFLENLLESLEGGILAVDKNMKVTAFNRAAEKITGLKREEVLHKECDQVLKGDLCQDECPVKKVMKTGEPVYCYEVMITNKAGKKIPVHEVVHNNEFRLEFPCFKKEISEVMPEEEAHIPVAGELIRAHGLETVVEQERDVPSIAAPSAE